MIMMTLLIATTGMATATLDNPTSADDPNYETVSKIIRFDDLDLTGADGPQQLENRVKRAARSLCLNGEQIRSSRSVHNECIDQMVENSRPQIERAVDAANKNDRSAGA